MSNTSTYESPLSSRYASDEMLRLFSADKKFSTWRRLWVALARGEMELGLPVTAEQVAEGILEALDKLGSSKPLVVRFDGNAAAEGLSILARADRANLHVAQTMEEAAQQAAHLAANGREVR